MNIAKLVLLALGVSFGQTSWPATFVLSRTSPTAPTSLRPWNVDSAATLKTVHDTANAIRALVPDSARAARIADTAKRAGWSSATDSARVAGLSDSAKALVRYARTTAVHDTADSVRAYVRARIEDSLAGYLPLAAGASSPLTGELYASQGVRVGANMLLRDLVGVAGFGAVYGTTNPATDANYLLAFQADASEAYFNATSKIGLDVNGNDMVLATAAGVTLTGTTTLSALGAGFVRANSAGALSASALTYADIPALDASKVTTGTFPDARIASSPTWNAKLSTVTADATSRAANTVYAAPNGSAGTAVFRLLVAADIPSLDAGKITTGTFADARIASAATWNAKEPGITAGTTAQYWRGDKSWQTLNTTVVPEGTNLYYTDARARASISGSAPISYSSSTGVISHLATDGNLHVPATSTTNGGKFLKAGSTAGSIAWASLTYSDLTGTVPTWNQNTTGSAAKWTTARTIAATGDASWSVSFDGSANVSAALTLAASGVTAGTYGSASVVPVPTVDAKGRVTAITTATITPSGIGAQAALSGGTTGALPKWTSASTLGNSQITDDGASVTVRGLVMRDLTTNAAYAAIYGASATGGASGTNFGVVIKKDATEAWLNGTTYSKLAVGCDPIVTATSAGAAVTGALSATSLAGTGTRMATVASDGMLGAGVPLSVDAWVAYPSDYTWHGRNGGNGATEATTVGMAVSSLSTELYAGSSGAVSIYVGGSNKIDVTASGASIVQYHQRITASTSVSIPGIYSVGATCTVTLPTPSASTLGHVYSINSTGVYTVTIAPGASIIGYTPSISGVGRLRFEGVQTGASSYAWLCGA